MMRFYRSTCSPMHREGSPTLSAQTGSSSAALELDLGGGQAACGQWEL